MFEVDDKMLASVCICCPHLIIDNYVKYNMIIDN